MAYKVQDINLKDDVYQLCCKKRHYSQCTAAQLLQELREAGVKFEGDRSYEQLSQILSQLIQENKIWMDITNLDGSAMSPGVQFQSLERIKEDLESHFGHKCVARTVRLVKEQLGNRDSLRNWVN